MITLRNIAPGSKGLCFAPVHSHQPSKAEEAPQSDLRYQTPGAGDSAENHQPAEAGLAGSAAVGGVEWEKTVGQAVVVWEDSVPYPESDAADRNRPAVEYSGYTRVHLPVKKESAPLPSAADAAFASFAARMAFSSF